MAPLWRPPPGRWTCGAGFRSVRLSLGPAPRGRGDKDPSSVKTGTEARRPRLPTRPAAPAARPARRRCRSGCQHRPAPRGGREEEGEARAGGGGCRQTAPPGGAEASPIRPSQLEPGSASPHIPPPPPPAPSPTAQPRRPPPCAHALCWAPASLSDWVGLVFRAPLKARDKLRVRRQRPWAAPQVCSTASAGLPEHLRGGGSVSRTRPAAGALEALQDPAQASRSTACVSPSAAPLPE